MTRLPRSVDDLRGLRVARWIRESTTGQFDRYGPGAQRELQAGAIRRHDLVDTGLEWSAAQSGATVHGSPAMRAMLAAAAEGEFDLLLVGYVARWQRNLRQTLNLLEEDLHPAGVAVWFCDEELLSSNERHWDQLVDEAKAADSWLRKHRRRVREGYAAKRAEQRDPGGRAPFGLRRDRDARALEAAMAVLDEQEAAARELVAPTAMEAAEVVGYLRDLPRLWDDAPLSRRALSESLFERVDVLGLRSMHLEPTPAAIARGLAEAFLSASAGYGRGERTHASASQQIRGCRVTMSAPERRIRLVG